MIPTVLAQSYPLISPERRRSAPEGNQCPPGRASPRDCVWQTFWLRLLRGDEKPNQWHSSGKMAVKVPSRTPIPGIRVLRPRWTRSHGA